MASPGQDVERLKHLGLCLCDEGGQNVEALYDLLEAPLMMPYHCPLVGEHLVERALFCWVSVRRQPDPNAEQTAI